eukprot:7899411-Pyramimonas_sp.AAC.1
MQKSAACTASTHSVDPSCSFSASPGLRPGRPQGQSGDLRGGRLAREKVEQGGAMCIHHHHRH